MPKGAADIEVVVASLLAADVPVVAKGKGVAEGFEMSPVGKNGVVGAI